jgi:hypothetical protein
MRVFRALRVKNQAPWIARLALFALLFQISALDHHTHNIEDLTGLIGSSQHAMHCHGAVGTCVSGAVELPTILTQPTPLPSTPSLMLLATVGDYEIPADAFVAPGTEPPRI